MKLLGVSASKFSPPWHSMRRPSSFRGALPCPTPPARVRSFRHKTAQPSGRKKVANACMHALRHGTRRKNGKKEEKQSGCQCKMVARSCYVTRVATREMLSNILRTPCWTIPSCSSRLSVLAQNTRCDLTPPRTKGVRLGTHGSDRSCNRFELRRRLFPAIFCGGCVRRKLAGPWQFDAYYHASSSAPPEAFRTSQ